MSKCSFWLSVAILVCLSSRSFAQELPGFGDADKVAIDQMYDRYSQAFFAKDYAKLLEVVQTPFVVFLGSVMTLESPTALASFYRDLVEGVYARGFDHGEVVDTRIIPLTQGRAILATSFRRYRKDGSLLEELAALYLVTKSSGTWKLCGLMSQDFKNFGKTF